MFITQAKDKTIRDGGATVAWRTQQFLEPIDAWFYPEHPGLTEIVTVDELEDALLRFTTNYEDLLLQPNMFLGTWVNPNSGLCYLDITTYCIDGDVAAKRARKRSQQQGRQIISIYNPVHQQAKNIWLEILK